MPDKLGPIKSEQREVMPGTTNADAFMLLSLSRHSIQQPLS